jgi:hypothetical protein
MTVTAGWWQAGRMPTGSRTCASGWATLAKGTRAERIRTREVPPEQGALARRAFVRERGGGRYAYGLDPDAPLETFEREAGRHPVFQILD